MRKKWVMEIEVKHQETLVIRQPRSAARPSCPACGGTATMILPEEATVVADANLRAVFR